MMKVTMQENTFIQLYKKLLIDEIFHSSTKHAQKQRDFLWSLIRALIFLNKHCFGQMFWN